MLWASPPDDGADADGRFDVDSVLVTEFLLSFVGTLAGRNNSSDIAACIQRAQAFQSFLGQGRFQRGYVSFAAAAAAWSQRVQALGDTNKRSMVLQRRSVRSQSVGRVGVKPVTQPPNFRSSGPASLVFVS